jgi:putative membrane protein
MRIDTTGHARIAEAIERAESTTSGEIACVLETDGHVYFEWVLGVSAFLAFLLPFLLTLAGFGPSAWAALLPFGWEWDSLTDIEIVELYAAVQVAIFIVLGLLFWWSPLAQRWAPEGVRRDRVHEMALKQFLARGVHLTADRTGVLIFVSLKDRMTEIVADEGIYAKVSPDVWAEADAALLSGIRRDDVIAGFEAAITIVGGVLAEHFPPRDRNPDELPNRLIEM